MHVMQRVLIALTMFSLWGIAPATQGMCGQLDDHYLAAFAQRQAGSGTALEKAVLSVTPAAAVAVRSGTPLKHGLSRDWNQLEPATQKVLAKELALPVLSGGEQVVYSPGGFFRIHYTTSGADAPNIALLNSYTGLNLASATEWANRVGQVFDSAYTFYQGLGYHMPPANPFEIYLKSLVSVGEYGETDNLQMVGSAAYPYASSSYIMVDKDFTNPIFNPQAYTPLESLQVTSVHEFHHAVQYGYSFYFDVWYAEATSTWYESELYPAINQNYSYLAGWFDHSTRQIDLPQSDASFSSQAYGRWIFNRFLAERHSGAAVRSFWEKLAGLPPIGGQDVPMLPVLDMVLSSSYGSTLATEFFELTKRVYTRDWPTSANVSGAQVALIPRYAPTTSFLSYPVSSNSLTLPHYSFAYYRFAPSSSTATLTISLAKSSGIQAAVFKTSNGTVSEVVPAADGVTFTVANFNTLNASADEVALLLANTTGIDGQNANFSTNGSVSKAQDPSSSGGTVTSTASDSGPNKSACFIATAAYGSYLHPKVALLRDFRDRRLLTNAPGRLFVRCYYRISPPIADLIARHEFLRSATRLLLAPLLFAVEHAWCALMLLCLVPLWALRSMRGRIGGAIPERQRES